jgi:LAO/AO transport system kinase
VARAVDVPDLVERARAGQPRAVARLISLVEDASPALREVAAALTPFAGRAHVVGLTGSPGVGKSTTTSALVTAYRAQGLRIGVLAVDPSSPFTGGALLGDRVRMQAHAGDDGVFIRSMASRGHAGGLAATTTAAATVLDAAGFDLVLIETVGTGQSEVEVAAIADTTVVVQAPEMGDEVQALKAGLLEVADIVVVNKADRPGADRAAAQLRAMLTMGAEPEPGDGDGQADLMKHDARRSSPKRPSVMLASGLTSAGVPGLLAALDDHHARRAATAQPHAARLARARAQVEGILADRVRETLWSADRRAAADALVARVAAHEVDPYTAADDLLADLARHA